MIARLDALLTERGDRVQDWFNGHLKRIRMPIYTSVDFRNAGFKISPVDTNLYPSGFNNLCCSLGDDCAISFRPHIQARYGNVKRILIIAEAHTRNPHYIENIKNLIRALIKDGYEARAGLASADLWKDSVELDGTSGKLNVGRIFRDGDNLKTADFAPDLIVNNNDFSEGIPEMLNGAAQPIDPPPELGWAMRRKNLHFEILDRLTGELAEIISLDPWLIHPITKVVQDVDFRAMDGLDRIAHTIADVLEGVQSKYAEHSINEEPFAFIKSNYGTYGLAITTATSSEEFLEKINKEKKKMQKGKSGVEVRSVIVQEGIRTADLHNECPAEPVIYIVGGEPVGGFYRINCKKTPRGNLNTPGMTFSSICFHKAEDRKPASIATATYTEAALKNALGTIARVAAMAAAYEMST